MAKEDKKSEAPSTEVAVVEAPSTEVAASATGAFDYGEDAGSGFEGTKGTDLSVPFLGVLQSNSPQIENDDPPGSKVGMLFNTVTRELISGEEGLPFLPCYKEGPVWVEWIPRTKGGGFVALHDPESDAVKNSPPILNDEGKETRRLRYGENELIETFYMYGLFLDEDMKSTIGFAVVSFTSTKIKPYRDFVTAMYTLKGKPPIFANRARIRTVKQFDKANHAFYNFRIDPLDQTWSNSLVDPKTDAALLKEGKEFQEMVISGMARASFETERSTGDGTGAAAPTAGDADDDTNIPF